MQKLKLDLFKICGIRSPHVYVIYNCFMLMSLLFLFVSSSCWKTQRAWHLANDAVIIYVNGI